MIDFLKAIPKAIYRPFKIKERNNKVQAHTEG